MPAFYIGSRDVFFQRRRPWSSHASADTGGAGGAGVWGTPMPRRVPVTVVMGAPLVVPYLADPSREQVRPYELHHQANRSRSLCGFLAAPLCGQRCRRPQRLLCGARVRSMLTSRGSVAILPLCRGSDISVHSPAGCVRTSVVGRRCRSRSSCSASSRRWRRWWRSTRRLPAIRTCRSAFTDAACARPMS